MKKIKHGDTIVEVCICVSIFALVCIFTIGLMNNGLNTAQRTLEVTMARTAIDSQAEALRFIHNNYLSERNSNSTAQFKKIWQRIKDYSRDPNAIKTAPYANVQFDINNYNNCEEIYNGPNEHINRFSAFVINPRLIVPDLNATYRSVSYTESGKNGIIDNMIVSNKNDGKNKMKAASLYPRIIYQAQRAGGDDDSLKLKENNSNLFQFVNSAEGIWVIAIHENENDLNRSEFFDFYIRTCWMAAGNSASPSTITTIVRLYNPETIQE